MKTISKFIIILTLIPTLSFSKITETVLKNGLKIIIKEDHRAPVMVSQIWYKVGSSYEHNGITGISHMLEHMMFKGTKNLGINEFSKIIAANGGDENAFTGRDYTAYYQKMESSRYPISFKLEADRMRNLLLNKTEFLKEREVVTEERRMRTDNNPSSLAYEQFLATAYTSSPYHHPVIGWANDIENYTLEDLSTWYKNWYAPNNATLVVVGDVNPNAVIKSAIKYFGKIKPQPIKKPKPQLEIKLLGEKSINTYSSKVKIPSITLGFPVPNIMTTKIKWEPYAIEVLAYILDGGKSSRLSKTLIRQQKIASSTGVGYNPIQRLQSLFTMQATPSNKHTIQDVKQGMLKQIDLLKNKLVTNEELKRVISQLVASQTFERDSIFYQAMQIGQTETIGMSWKTAENFVSNIKLVTKEQIQTIAKKYLNTHNMISSSLLPAVIKNPRNNR